MHAIRFQMIIIHDLASEVSEKVPRVSFNGVIATGAFLRCSWFCSSCSSLRFLPSGQNSVAMLPLFDFFVQCKRILVWDFSVNPLRTRSLQAVGLDHNRVCSLGESVPRDEG